MQQTRIATTPTKITHKQRLFIAAYLGESGGNATDAARRAGFKHPRHNITRLMNSPPIRAEIEAQYARSAMSVAEVLARLTEFGRADMADFLAANEDGSLRLDELGHPRLDLERARQAGKLHLIDQITPSEHGPRVKLVNRLESLNLLGKAGGLFTERVEIEVRGDPDRLRAELAAKLSKVIPSLSPADRAILGGSLALPAPQ